MRPRRAVPAAATAAAVPTTVGALAALLVIVGLIGWRQQVHSAEPQRGRSATVTSNAAVFSAERLGMAPRLFATAPRLLGAAPMMARTPSRFSTAPSTLIGSPTRLRVAAIDLDIDLEVLRIGPDGALRPPRDFSRAGWYAAGTAPGDVGPAVIGGHADSRTGPAVFYRLRELGLGDRIEVTRGGVAISFTVTSTAWYPKAAFPSGEVYGPTPDRQLRLITCGGVFDRSSRAYRDNFVVYAVHE